MIKPDAETRGRGDAGITSGLGATNIVIRSARPGDIPRLAELLADLFTLESDFAPDVEKHKDGLSYLLADPAGRSHVVVAEQAGDIIGMVSVQTLFSTAEGGRVGLVEDVIVDRNHRGQGIGTELLEAVEAWSRKKGLRRLQLLADQENPSAGDFYSKNGWCCTNLMCRRLLL